MKPPAPKSIPPRSHFWRKCCALSPENLVPSFIAQTSNLILAFQLLTASSPAVQLNSRTNCEILSRSPLFFLHCWRRGSERCGILNRCTGILRADLCLQRKADRGLAGAGSYKPHRGARVMGANCKAPWVSALSNHPGCTGWSTRKIAPNPDMGGTFKQTISLHVLP